jgi:hypothetical protein
MAFPVERIYALLRNAIAFFGGASEIVDRSRCDDRLKGLV